jgi:Cu+-exporting ATPase
MSHIDPVCGMTVEDDSPRRFAFDGTTYYFCSDHCLAKFSADPARYLAPTPALPPKGEAQVAPGATYTCPMHPEVRQQGPGTCPKCGMALEPEMPSLEEGENPELVDSLLSPW